MSAGSGRLHHAIQALKTEWENAGDGWNDKVRRDFEKDYMLPLDTQVNGTVRAMQELDEVLIKMRRECGPDRETF